MIEYLFNVGITEDGFSAICDELNIIVGSKPTFEELKDYIKESMDFYWEEENKEGKETPKYKIKYNIHPFEVEFKTEWDDGMFVCHTDTNIPMLGIVGNGYTPAEAQKDVLIVYFELSESLKSDGIIAPLISFKFV